MSSGQVTVWFRNNDGSGFAGQKTTAEGTTLEQFLGGELHNSLDSYLVRVNSEECMDATYVLKSGDKVSATPCKISGAS